VTRRPSPKAAAGAVLALLAAAAPAGCGDDDGGETRAVTVPAGRAITIKGDEYSFDPNRVVVTGARGATDVELVLDNDGALAHNARIERGGDDLGGTPTFQGGEPRRARVRLSPGTYELICTVGDHAELGMTGELEVR
jgi:plastocyanin